MKIIVIGAGLAGLTCAKALTEGGAEAVVFEASDGVGGRVRTDEVDGFLLDRGFQVYFTAYPAARRQLDHEALDLRSFDPGAVVRDGGRRYVLSDPIRDPAAILPSLFSGAATFGDKVTTLARTAETLGDGAESVRGLNVEQDSASALEYLRASGFSEQIVDNFFRPFYGGIFLDRSLSTSYRVFRFTLGMMATGRVAVPARGMGEIPRQLAAHLPEDAVRLDNPVSELLRDGDQVAGVRAAGEEHEADAVVVATEAPAAGELTGEDVPEGAVGEICAYYETDRPADGTKISLNASQDAFLNNAEEMSAVSERYAPPGRNLLSAVTLGTPHLTDEEVYRRGIEELGEWFPETDFRPLAIYRLPYCQFAQPPGVHDTLPPNRTATPGLYLAGEFTEDASINGSMLSGEKAARAVFA